MGHPDYKNLILLGTMPTKARISKIESVLLKRQPDLRIVLEEVTNTHNASAVVRTCDAAGVLNVDLVYASSDPFPVNEAISTRSEKWLNLERYTSTSACLNQLKQQGYQIAATHLGPDAVPYSDIDYARPIAIVFGNESEGISSEALDLADHIIKIPMKGMAQSLNLSVSVGIILYEALRQRAAAKYVSQLTPKDFLHLKNKWLKKKGD